jgi:hypothetical protein
MAVYQVKASVTPGQLRYPRTAYELVTYDTTLLCEPGTDFRNTLHGSNAQIPRIRMMSEWTWVNDYSLSWVATKLRNKKAVFDQNRPKNGKNRPIGLNIGQKYIYIIPWIPHAAVRPIPTVSFAQYGMQYS